jgi:LacI family transcriptional regulator
MDSREINFKDDDFKKIHAWYENNQPDVIISYLDCTYKYFKSMGYRVPEDLGFLALTWTGRMGDCSGYDQCHEKVGAAAVDIVVESIYRNERGIPNHSTTTILEGEFIPGNTLRKVPGSVVSFARKDE